MGSTFNHSSWFRHQGFKKSIARSRLLSRPGATNRISSMIEKRTARCRQKCFHKNPRWSFFVSDWWVRQSSITDSACYNDENWAAFGGVNADRWERLEFWRILCESFSSSQSCPQPPADSLLPIQTELEVLSLIPSKMIDKKEAHAKLPAIINHRLSWKRLLEYFCKCN